MASIVKSHPTEFFRELVQAATQAQGIEPPEHTEYYLVQLLERHVRLQAELFDQPLSTRFLEASRVGPPENLHLFQVVGDSALFIVGLFADRLERGLVPPTFYIDIGEAAYQRASQLGGALSDLFEELAVQFRSMVRVLGQISSDDLFATDRDTLRTYRRWLLTRSQADAEELSRRGIILSEPSRARH